MMSLDSEAEVWGLGYPVISLGPGGAVGLAKGWLTISLTNRANGSSGAGW